ncbi:hypothetical protein EB001_13370 [bacterium]|nr:hypothetical protein [bacterium]
MVDIDIAKSKISDWIINFLDVPQETLNNIAPCPYAKNALLGNKIKFSAGGENIIDDMLQLHYHWDMSYDGVVIVYSKDIEVERFVNSVAEVNSSYYPYSGLLALEDHPQIDETIAGIKFNNGDYALVIVQPAVKLHKAMKILQTKGYYKNWTQQDLDNVVNWRW